MPPSEVILFFSLFARIFGFFMISPLFSHRGIPPIIRFGLAVVCALLIAPPFTTLKELSIEHPLPLLILLLKELALGYLIGFFFALLIEAAALAGQIVGTLCGFSATELFDLLSTSSQPLIARLFSLTLFALFLSFDFHHDLLRILFESFNAFPVDFYPFNGQIAHVVLEAFSQLFKYALMYAAFPLGILFLLISLFALVSRILPDLPIFWVGFPIQLLIGFGAIAVAVTYFGDILNNSFLEFLILLRKAFFSVENI